MARKSKTVAAFIGLVVCSSGVLHAQDADSVLIRIRFNNAYDDSDRSTSDIRMVSAAFPPIQGRLPPGGTISALVVEQYGFGPSELPRSYAVVERRILDLNKWSSPADAKAGPIVLPFLPKRALTRPSPFKLGNRFPGLATVQIALKSSRIVRALARPAAAGLILEARVPRGVLTTGGWGSFLTRPDVGLSTIVEIAYAARAAAPLPLTASDRTTLMNVVAKAKQRSTVVIVVDRCWPDQASQTAALAFFKEMSARVRSHYSLPVADFTWQIPWKEPSGGRPHCRDIQRALEDIVGIVTDVPVIYLPLNLEQGSAPLVRELLTLHFILDALNTRWQDWDPAFSVPADIRTNATLRANEVVTSLTVQNSPNRTDTAVLWSLSSLLSQWGDDRNGFGFVNESWTVPGGAIKFWTPPLQRALTVVAAGNDDGDVFEKHVDFAQRSIDESSLLAVINTDRIGRRQCKTSYFEANALPLNHVVGFDGGSAEPCGTSLAAPSVALMIAATESRRAQEYLPNLWAASLQKALRDSRPQGAGLDGIYFDLGRFASVWK